MMKIHVLILSLVAAGLTLSGASYGVAGGLANGATDGPTPATAANEPLDVGIQNFPWQCITYVSSDVPVATLFFSTSVSTIDVPHDFTITDVDVGPITLSHDHVGDLNLHLQSPQGTTVELHTPAFSGGSNYISTVFSDEAILPITAGAPPFGGTYRPEGALSDIDLESSQGIWELQVENTSNWAGNIYAWSLRLCGFYGQTVVVPSAQQTAEGNAQNSWPFDIAALPAPSMRYQQVYGAGDLPGRGRVTQIAFRPNGSVADPFKEYYIDAEIRLAHTDAVPDGLSATFADNLDRDVTLVYDGPLFLSSAAAGAVPQAFDIVIGMQAPFWYNGEDNLLLDVRISSSPSTVPFDAQNQAGDSVSRAFAYLVSDSVADFTDSYGLVTQFTMDSDADGDGCTNAQELGVDVTQGGQRNAKSFWDFFDVPTGTPLARDRNVASLDIFQVLGRFNATDAGPGDFDRSSDPLSTPNALTPGAHRANYHPAYDRGPLVGPNVWNLGPADGAIAAPDIFAVLAQFGHSCA